MISRPKSNPTGRISIGTSGWSYDGWRGELYPQALAKKEWLRFYSAEFPSTEINASFYRTPTLAAVTAWRSQTPERFSFSWKASKFITHWKRIGPSCTNSIALMETRLKVLAPKLALVLFQLPPNFAKDEPRLTAFLEMLPAPYRYAFEFRHKSWYAERVFDVLRRQNIALCISDHADAPAPWETTSSHVYVRGHGPSGRYKGSYSSRTLRRWADAIVAWQNQRRDVFVYFDNDQKAAAPLDAKRLLGLIGRMS